MDGRDPRSDGAQQFVAEVFPAELDAIASRRNSAGVAALPELTGGPTVEHGLVGLALSGGGIRSAAFNLGLLQALHAHGVLRHVDYLSTVSGGGWIGCALASLLRDPGREFPFAHAAGDGAHESAAVSHLRDRSAALIPSGLAGKFVVASTILRGQLATAMMMIPVAVLLAVAAMPLVFAYIGLRSAHAPSQTWTDIPWTWFTAGSRWVVLAVFAWMLLGFFYVALERPSPARRRRLERSFGWALMLAVLAVFVELQPMAVLHTHVFLFGVRGESWRVGDVLKLAVAAGSAFSLGPLSSALPRVARPIGLGLATVVSLTAPYLFFLFVEASLVRMHFYGGLQLDEAFVALLLVVTAVLLTAHDVNVMSLHGFYRDRLTRVFLLRRDAEGLSLDEELSLTALNREGSWAPYTLVNTAVNLQASDDRSLRGRNSDLFVFSSRFVGSARTGYCPTAAMEYVTPGLNLGTAMAISAAAAAPNMGTYTLRAVVLLMTLLNLRLGYWLPHPARVAQWARGRSFGDADAHDLARRWAWMRWTPRFPSYVRELFSRIHERGRHVFLTDGGHIENTGAYELLRRRCRVVIVSDVEEDRLMRFGGMAALIRYARIDLGVEIDIDLDDLRASELGWSRRHAAIGVIRYPASGELAEETGTILYVKSSVSGDEDELIEEYRARNEDFPHQATSNQLYDEAQFEAYRALGQHAVDGLFTRGANVGRTPEGLYGWLDELAARLTPDATRDPAFAELRDELEEVEELLRSDGCEGYFRELYPELAPESEAPPPREEVVSMVVSRQLHVMATAFNRLALDVPDAWSHRKNQGWMNLFRRWSVAPTFRRHWLVAVHQEGDAFRQFCEEALDLRLRVRWSVASEADVARAGLTLPTGGDAGAVCVTARFALGELETVTVLAARVSAGVRDATVHAWAVRPGYAGSLEARARRALADVEL